MRKEIKDFVNSLDRRNFTNNVQRVLHTLLLASISGKEWVSTKSFRTRSAAARLRDLRKTEYGEFGIDCRQASDINRNGTQYTFFYRIKHDGLTLTKLRRIFQ
jgi:hypothetical protein